MKVLLINPPYPFEESPTPPFGLMALAAYLLEHAPGVDVKIEDYIVTPYSKERLQSVMDEYKPDIAGATGVTMNIKSSLKILKDVKDIDPRVITVMGGPHVTFDAQNMLNDNAYIDYIVRGEGELTFTEMLDKIKSKEPMSSVLGVSYRDGAKIVHNENRPLIEDINILPYPARHLVQLSKYKALGLPINMVTSRGCPHKCIFCVGSRMVGQKVRNYDVKRVVDEFEMLSKMGFRQINIVDDLFTANKKRCMDICDEIMRRGIKHKWNAFARVDTVSKELLEKLLEAGCTTLCFGIESGNQEILDRVKKKTNLEKIQKAIDLCNETGMEPMASYILGLPGETADTIKTSLEFAKNLCYNYGFHVLSPFPGTEVRDKCAEYGLSIMTDDWDRYNANRSVCELESVSPQEIDKIAEDFELAAKRYVDNILERNTKGEKLSEYDTTYIFNIFNICFTMDIINGCYIENYPGIKGSESDVVKHFSSSLKGKINFTEDDINQRVQRLIEGNCISIKNIDGVSKILWN